jgi:hypothetical protein
MLSELRKDIEAIDGFFVWALCFAAVWLIVDVVSEVIRLTRN